jgi:hypothetical protein
VTNIDRVHFAGWCSNHHLVEAVTSADIWDGSSYVQSCGTCGRPTRLGQVPDHRVGKPVREYAVFHALNQIDLGPCISRGYLTASQALQYADPGQLVAIMCPDDPDHDRPMAACADCLTGSPAAADTVIVATGVTEIRTEPTVNGDPT